MPGPPPKPTAALRLAGSWRASTREREPVLPLVVPQPPTWLQTSAQEAWNDLIACIGPMRVLTNADALALAMFATYLAEWRTVTEMLNRYGEATVVERDGEVVEIKRSPYVKMQLDYGLMIRRFMQEFGLTPSARTRVAQTHEPDNVDAIFSRKAAAAKRHPVRPQGVPLPPG